MGQVVSQGGETLIFFSLTVASVTLYTVYTDPALLKPADHRQHFHFIIPSVTVQRGDS